MHVTYIGYISTRWHTQHVQSKTIRAMQCLILSIASFYLQALDAALRSAGWHVRLVTDPSAEDLREALHSHSRVVDEAAASLVYFAGHGATYGKHYLLPADFSAPPGKTSRCVSICSNIMSDILFMATSWDAAELTYHAQCEMALAASAASAARVLVCC